ncbi:MAG TPA: hypothetical protein VMF52_03085 [Steroidobacteraceae bacterium]|nr:hypothetical protein [Steroidobacteraceae bacterium]
MKSFLNRHKRAGLACVALGAIAVSQTALAAGTVSTTTISNTATVNYTVGSVAQSPITSAAATFVVDNKVNLTLTRVGPTQTTVASGQTGATVAFRLENIGNTAQGYNFTVVDLTTGDTRDMNNESVHVSTAACTLASTTAPTYNATTDTLPYVNTLAPDSCRWVFIVADMPGVAVNGDTANLTLTATTAIANTTGAPSVQPQTGAGVADDKDTVQVVFADTGNNGLEAAQGGYIVSTATLAVVKTSTVISDPFNNTTFPKAIPGATMEYAITLSNTGGANASVTAITDTLPTNVTFVTNSYNAGASNVSVQVGSGAATFCNAESGSDTNADGCFRTAGGVLTVGAPAVSTVATGGATTQVAVRFRVTIN